MWYIHDDTVYYDTYSLYPTPNPQQIVTKKASRIPLRDHTIYLLIGPVLWHGVDILVQRLPAHSAIIALDMHPDLHAIAQNHIHQSPLFQAHARCSWCEKNTENAIQTWVNDFIAQQYKYYEPIRHITSITLSKARRFAAPQYKNLQHASEYFLQNTIQNYHITLFMGFLWVKNILHTIPSIPYAYDITQLKTQLPCVVCAAGESLEHTLAALTAIRTHIFLIAVDTALPCLYAANIIPDLVIILEAQWSNSYDFIGIDLSHIAIACDISSNHSIIRRFHPKKRFYFSSSCHNLSLIAQLETHNIRPYAIPDLGNVGICALYLASLITQNTIYFTGIDSCYQQSKPHARNTSHHIRYIQKYSRLSQHYYQPQLLSLHTTKKQYYTTKILYNNHKLLDYLSHIIINPNRIYDIRTHGLASPFSHITQQQFIQHCITNHYAPRATTTIIAKKQKIKSTDSTQYLMTIYHHINQLIIMLYDTLSHKKIHKNDNALLAHLYRLDFLLVSLSRKDKQYLTHPTTIMHILYYAQYYKQLLQNNISKAEKKIDL